MIKEFRDFIARGNVIDLAVAFIMGAAFGKIISSLVDDILMPPIGMLLGGMDFSNLFINLTAEPFESLAAAQAAGAPTINYGLFINTIISFLIVSFALFMVIRSVNAMKREEQAAVPAEPVTKDCPYCLTPVPIKASRCPACTSALVAE